MNFATIVIYKVIIEGKLSKVNRYIIYFLGTIATVNSSTEVSNGFIVRFRFSRFLAMELTTFWK